MLLLCINVPSLRAIQIDAAANIHINDAIRVDSLRNNVLSQFKNRNNSCLCAIGDRNRITQMIAIVRESTEYALHR